MLNRFLDWLIRGYYFAIVFLMLIPVFIFMGLLLAADWLDGRLGYGRD